MTTRSISSAFTWAAIVSTLPLPIKVAGRIAFSVMSSAVDNREIDRPRQADRLFARRLGTA